MSDMPRRAVTRTAKLATLPLGFAGRSALGFGKRLGGQPAEAVAAQVQAAHRRADLQGAGRAQGWRHEVRAGDVRLRGGAARGGRRALPRGADQAAGGRPADAGGGRAHRARATARRGVAGAVPVLRGHAGGGRQHRAGAPGGVVRRPRGGRQGAVSRRGTGADVRHQPADQAGADFSAASPGLDVKPLLRELRNRLSEELDYRLEAAWQRAFAEAYDGDPDVCVPMC